jgi:MFS transporter, DHA1 family, tetracycline resistance protein
VVFGIGGALWVLFLGRIIEGLTNGNISALFASAADRTRPEDRTRTFGSLSAAIGVGLIAGPLLGGALSTISVETPIYAVAVLMLINTVICYFWLPESLPPERRARDLTIGQLNPIARLGYVLRIPELHRPLLATILFTVPMAILLSNMPVYLNDVFGWGAERVSVLYAVYGGVVVLMQAVLMPHLLRRASEGQLATIGFVTSAIGYTLMPVAAWLGASWMVYLSASVIAVGNPLMNTPLSGMISKIAGPERQGRVQGGNLAIQTLANVAGPLVGGWMYITIAYTTPYWFGVGLLLAGAVIALGLRRIATQISEPATATPAENPSVV